MLADAGWRVLVLEAQAEPGGAVRSGELTHPGSCTTGSAPSTRSVWRRRSCAPSTWSRTGCGGDTRRRSWPTPRPTAAARCCRPTSTRRRRRSGSSRPVTATHGVRSPLTSRRLSGPLLDSMMAPIPPVRGPVRLATTLGPRGLLEFTRQALLSVRRLAQERFRGEGAALLLTGNAMHSDVGPDVPPSGFLGWLLTGLGQEVGFPVPEGGVGRAHPCAGSPAHGARRRGALRGTGRAASRCATGARSRWCSPTARRSPPPAGCSPTSARPRCTATSSARSTCPRTCSTTSAASSTTWRRSRSTGRCQGRSRGGRRAPSTPAPSTSATAWTSSRSTRPTSRRTGSRPGRSCSSGR